MEEQSQGVKMRYKYFFGLLLAHFLYSMVGMVVFHLLEEPNQTQNEINLHHLIEDFLGKYTLFGQH